MLHCYLYRYMYRYLYCYVYCYAYCCLYLNIATCPWVHLLLAASYHETNWCSLTTPTCLKAST